MSCSGMPIPSQAGAETAVISSAVVLAAEGVEARRQTRQVLKFSNCREGMVQTTNLKRAAKAEVGSIIPWLQVRILPVLLLFSAHIFVVFPIFFGSNCESSQFLFTWANSDIKSHRLTRNEIRLSL